MMYTVRVAAMSAAFVAFSLFSGSTATLQAQTVFRVILDAQQAVPPGNSTQVGTGTLYLDPDTLMLEYGISISGTDSPLVAAVLQRGAVGASGTSVGLLSPVGLAGADPQAFFGTMGPLSPPDTASLRDGALYVAILTQDHAAGALRGQITAAANHLVAVLDPHKVVTGSPVSMGSGYGQLTIQSDGSLDYTIDAQDLNSAASNIHIHEAPPGVAGPVLAGLSTSGPPYQGTTPPLTGAQLATIRAGQTYFKIHTQSDPTGELRGQLVTAHARCHSESADVISPPRLRRYGSAPV